MTTGNYRSLALIPLLALSPVASADSIIESWTCTLKEGKTLEELVNVSSQWLKAARTMSGGDQTKVNLMIPMVPSDGTGKFQFIAAVPDTSVWGAFNKDYEGSPAAKVDEAWSQVADCSSNSLWASVEIK
jgi:hypothetical protein